MQLTANVHVLSGFTWNNLLWSFGPESPCSPLTWSVYAAGYDIFGLNPGVFHSISLLIHIASSLLLLFLLNRITGEFWKSAFVGILFAIHPINVETVAWIAELNNVLSGLFFMLTLVAYSSYVKHPSWTRYGLALIVFGLGLLAKPVLMTLPFILLLLDYWPLKRVRLARLNEQKGEKRNDSNSSKLCFQGVPVYRLVLEKVPFLALSLLSIGSTLVSVRRHTEFSSLEILPLSLRLSNALVSYVKYLGHLFWPLDLAVLQPYPGVIPFIHVAAAGTLLLVLTAFSLRTIYRYPYFFIGWLWFLGSLVPFLGIIQAGLWAETADRYAYLTFIPIFIILSWGLPDLFGRRIPKTGIAVASFGIICILAVLTNIQAGYWKNNVSLYEHAINVDPDNEAAYGNLGAEYLNRGDTIRAIDYLHQALKLKPDSPKTYFNLGMAYARQNDAKNALECHRSALRINPDDADAHLCIGIILMSTGKVDEAAEHFHEAVRLNPESLEARRNLGNILLGLGYFDEAIRQYSHALIIDRRQADILNNIGIAYIRKGNIKKGLESFHLAVQVRPDYADARKNFENARKAHSKAEDSIANLDKMVLARPDDPILYAELGDCYWRLGEVDQAVYHYQKSLSVQPGFLQAMHGLVLIYMNKEDYDKSIELLHIMREINPNNPDVYYNIACAYAKKNMKEESVSWLKQAIHKGFKRIDLIRNDSDLAAVRNTEYVKNLVHSSDPSGIMK
jgi:tetratricopeptide (TPR) repeat protein